MLRRLCAYPRQNGSARTLREARQVELTPFVLNGLEYPHLRRRATAELNRSEARNAFARAVCFNRLCRVP